MEDDTSTAPIDTEVSVVDEPATDPVMDILSDTESQPEESAAVETPEPEAPEAETTPEVEPTEEKTEEVEAPVDPKEEARRRYEERQAANEARRQQIESAAREDGEKYVKAGEDEYDQRLREREAHDALIDAQQYVNNVERNEERLVNEFERAKANPDLQIFNPENKEQFNDKAYQKAIKDFNAGYLAYDNNGNIVEVKGSLFEHLTETAELLQESVKAGAVQQVRATQKMRATADTKPAATPKTEQKDAILDILMSDD